MEKKATIICGFTGIGKTYFCNCNNNVLDLDANKYSSSRDFPKNYYLEIINSLYDYSYILISTHESIRNLLKINDIPYYLIFPSIEQKKEYLNRFLARGNSISYCYIIQKSWDKWINSMVNDKYANKIVLHNSYFLSDVMYQIK